jgi:CubicO group peptidase (beta-lactamase class C family)
MDVEVKGYCDDKFAAVKNAFRKNFEDDLEVGASFAATVDGKFVVDIWGGYADEKMTRPWEKDTIVNVYSTTKVMTAICAHMLVDRGLLDVDAPVAKYWPEFAQAGKENIPVRYLLSHQSGLSGVDEPITVDTFYDWDRMIKLLEKQKPLWEPGQHCGYHAITFGYLIGEILRRITGKTLGTFFREEVAIPLNADFYIGLPAEHDSRVADLIPAPDPSPGDPMYIDPEVMSEAAKKAMNPPLNKATALRSRERGWRGAEIPAANGHGNARSIARVGAAMACGGELDGVRLMGLPTIEKAMEEQIYDTDLVMNMPVRYGLGFGLNSPEMPISPNQRAFTWGGWGGSKFVADLDARLSWGYAMNKMWDVSAGVIDTRTVGPVQALYDSLA